MPSKSLEDACSQLREAVPQILDKFNGKYGPRLIAKVGEVMRTDEEQQQKYAQGRTALGPIITYADGVTHRSAHQRQTFHGETCSHAVDINVFDDDGTYLGNWPHYVPLVGLAIVFGVMSGGDWVRKDWPHLQCVDFK